MVCGVLTRVFFAASLCSPTFLSFFMLDELRCRLRAFMPCLRRIVVGETGRRSSDSLGKGFGSFPNCWYFSFVEDRRVVLDDCDRMNDKPVLAIAPNSFRPKYIATGPGPFREYTAGSLGRIGT